MTDYSEPVDWLKMLSDGTSGPTARAVEALQADRDHWKARAERAESILAGQLNRALDNQEGEQ